MKQRVKVAVSGYLVTVTFGAIYVATRVIAPHQPQTVALGAAIVMALPLAIAFIGDKIKSFKGFGIEVETKAAAEKMTEIGPDQQHTSGGYDIPAIADSRSVPSNDSGTRAGGIPGQVLSLISSPDSRLVEVDLRDGRYWWATRLFLLAALLDEFTNVRRLVFVQSVDGQTKYAGMAEPAAVTRRIELALPGVKEAYRLSRERAALQVGPPPSAASVERVVELTSFYWVETVESFGIYERDEQHRVSRSWLQNTLGNDWCWAAINAGDQLDSPLLQYQVLTSAEDYTALLTDGRLGRVIGKSRLAVSIATAYLKQRLNS